MASQPRGPWFRFSLGSRAPAPAPPPPPPAPVAPAPPPVRLSFPIRPTLTQQLAPPPPPRSPSPPPAPTPAPQPSPPRAPVAPAPAAAPIRPSIAPPPSPTVPAPAAAPIRPSVAPPPAQPSPLRSPTRTPPPATKSPQTSPVQKQTLTTSTNASLLSSSPKTKSQSSPSSFTRTSPPKPVATAAATEAVNPKAPSPKIIKPFERAPAESPKTKPLSRPPSPLTLPPTQTKSDGEQKTVVEDKSIDKTVKLGRARNNGIAREQNTPKDKGSSRKFSDSEDQVGIRVITLAGENKGASMEVNPSQKKSHQNGEEGKSRNKEKGNGSQMAGYFNSNVQGLNNSLIYNSNVGQNDPGIHLSLTRKANAKD